MTVTVFGQWCRGRLDAEGGIAHSGFYLPKSGIEIRRTFPPVLGSGSPNFWLKFPPLFWTSFPSKEKILSKV